jgi:hypothetical protein
MRFSDMMGSGEERSLPSSENDNAISDALAPYLGAPPKTEAAGAGEGTVETLREAETDAPTPRAHTVGSVFPVIPVPFEAIASPAPPAPVTRLETAPVATNESITTAIADFTPLSDDLLPRRKR